MTDNPQQQNQPPTIWVDADACPNLIKAILFRAAERTGIELILMANQTLQTPPFPNIKSIQVNQGFDVADNEIVRRLRAGDLVITADIPLADEVLTKGGLALNPRGEMYSTSTIKAKLNMRDFMDTMRSSGIHSGGPAQLSDVDKRKFANALDSYLAKAL
ncbi:MAG: YaiI/YqxD family protein [Proteobacteria bacterium]|nr:YaiI/YqxD family protein [Pseudomonadota bacterium]